MYKQFLKLKKLLNLSATVITLSAKIPKNIEKCSPVLSLLCECILRIQVINFTDYGYGY